MASLSLYLSAFSPSSPLLTLFPSLLLVVLLSTFLALSVRSRFAASMSSLSGLISNFASLPHQFHALSLLGGDFNFAAHIGDAISLSRASHNDSLNSVARIFEDTFASFAELYQPHTTRADTLEGTRQHASRIDRLYTNLHHTISHSLHFLTHTL